jgi:hypothetical protein
MKRAEVSIILAQEMWVTIHPKQKANMQSDNIIFQIIDALFSQDFLQYDFHITTNLYFETVNKYASFFKNNEGFMTHVIQ